ncbi:acetate kinase [Humidesulfovibrio mexicanus]|uniref:Acetate kinase n=1 Tax=Humidesulfovibrio mexicanus TaxID=147047 RepID=A0A238Z2Y4_9BACT|nr:acetate kinase [Humidesulfovibrio mexicanus]SNR77815.1 acetate kinase [Humidesulfovibrio mexicanus]
MNVLVINSGSSSIKYQLLDMRTETVLCSGAVERIGEETGVLTHKAAPGTEREEKVTLSQPIADHEAGMHLVIDLIVHPERGVVKSLDEIEAIGHRIVQGGDIFNASCVVDDRVVDELTKLIPLGPVHNPGHLAGIRVARHLFPKVPQVTVFDTVFHQTMPPRAYMYALPYELYEELKVRRYGFHGTSHSYVSKEAARFLGKAPEETNLITVHLGNGSSMCAVQGGKSVDTSMGLTPLEGLIMGTRCGDADLAIYPLLGAEKGLSIAEINELTNKQSGFKGICGKNDMRDIHEAVAQGDARARLALDMFGYRNRKYIGSYLAVLGRVDAIVFTAGIGENDPVARELSCRGLEHLGIKLDPERNLAPERGARDISAPQSPVRVLVVPTNEELEIARQTAEVLAPGAKG